MTELDIPSTEDYSCTTQTGQFVKALEMQICSNPRGLELQLLPGRDTCIHIRIVAVYSYAYASHVIIGPMKQETIVIVQALGLSGSGDSVAQNPMNVVDVHPCKYGCCVHAQTAQRLIISDGHSTEGVLLPTKQPS